MQTLYEIYLQDLTATLLPMNSYLWFGLLDIKIFRLSNGTLSEVSLVFQKLSISTCELCFGREYETLHLSSLLGDSLTKLPTKLKCSI